MQDTIDENSKFYLGAVPSIEKDEFALRGLNNSYYVTARRDDAQVGCSLPDDTSFDTNVFKFDKTENQGVFLQVKFLEEFQLANGFRYITSDEN